MIPSNSSADNGAESTGNSVRFSDWLDPAWSWEPADRSAGTDSEEWPYAIDQSPPSEAECRVAKEREYERRSGEQAVAIDYSDMTERDD